MTCRTETAALEARLQSATRERVEVVDQLARLQLNPDPQQLVTLRARRQELDSEVDELVRAIDLVRRGQAHAPTLNGETMNQHQREREARISRLLACAHCRLTEPELRSMSCGVLQALEESFAPPEPPPIVLAAPTQK